MLTVGIVGATGAVGQELARVLEQRGFPAERYRLFASQRSAGRRVAWCGREVEIEALRPDVFADIDIAFFSAGGSVSRAYCPAAADAGAVVIDNSSAFRMDARVPLVVPEINAEAIMGRPGIIANPNCSTIILAVVLWPLHRHIPIRRIIVSTYQAASGAGARALAELETQTRVVLEGGQARPEVFPEPCAFNVFSHNSPVDEAGQNQEEAKMVAETRKIFSDNDLSLSVTCMRVPVLRAHLESASIEFERPLAAGQSRQILTEAPGVEVVDDPAAGRFPTSLRATGRDEVLVGRIRQDMSIPDGRGLQLVCAGDQLRKGAALNAVQIAELVLENRGMGSNK